jgi:hypothetical protein
VGVTCQRRVIGPRRHRCSWQHRELVESYRTARRAQEARAEEWSAGYATELAAFYRDQERPLTFREWLQHRERQPDQEAA